MNTGALGVERVAHSQPYAARGANRAKLFGHRCCANCRAKRAIRSGEDIGAQDTEVLVAAVEEIGNLREQLPLRASLIPRVRINDRVTWKRAVAIAIVFVAPRVLARRKNDAHPERPMLVDFVIGA